MLSDAQRAEIVKRRAFRQAGKRAHLAWLRAIEPELQRPHGMMRVCELMLVADVAQDMDLFISLGCGPCGCDMLAARERSKDLRIVGFERIDPRRDFGASNIEYRQVDLWWTPGVFDQIGELLATHGRSLVYCDNGMKLRELQRVSPLLKHGDIIGTHDYPGEVPDHKVGFLAEAGCTLYEKTELWIMAHYCLQRFWIKPSTGATISDD